MIFKPTRQLRIRIVGGLGNQLFGYFAGLHLSAQSNRQLILDMRDASKNHSEFDLRSFREVKSSSNFLERKHFQSSFLEKIVDSTRYRFPVIWKPIDRIFGSHADMNYETNISVARSKKRVIRFTGYFQDFSYLRNSKLDKLTVQSNPSQLHSNFGLGILGIHVRRGDFLNEKLTHGCLDITWYREAARKILNSHPAPKKIRIFSNDEKWVRENLVLFDLPGEIHIEIVEFNRNLDPAESFLEFSSCEFRICSNSTYSLLASFLSPGVTVVPYPYNRSGNFKALEESSPKSWIRVPSIWED